MLKNVGVALRRPFAIAVIPKRSGESEAFYHLALKEGGDSPDPPGSGSEVIYPGMPLSGTGKGKGRGRGGTGVGGSELPPLLPERILGDSEAEKGKPPVLGLTGVQVELFKILGFVLIIIAVLLFGLIALSVTLSVIQWFEWDSAIQIPKVTDPAGIDNYRKMLALSVEVSKATIGDLMGTAQTMLEALFALAAGAGGFYFGRKTKND